MNSFEKIAKKEERKKKLRQKRNCEEKMKLK